MELENYLGIMMLAEGMEPVDAASKDGTCVGSGKGITHISNSSSSNQLIAYLRVDLMKTGKQEKCLHLFCMMNQ